MGVTDILKKALSAEIPEDTERKLAVIAEHLQTENKKYNLTALTGDEEIALLHFADCMQLFRAADFRNKKVIDIGCGGGFPALVIAAAEKTCRVTALDSTEKKLVFVEETAKLADMRNIQILCGRAEEKAAEYRESFDIAVSRGVTRLNALCELCLPYVKTGGLFIAMKGEKAEAEAAEAENAVRLLGGSDLRIIPAPVPVRGDAHRLVVIKKTGHCPAAYPRTWARIKSKPL